MHYFFQEIPNRPLHFKAFLLTANVLPLHFKALLLTENVMQLHFKALLLTANVMPPRFKPLKQAGTQPLLFKKFYI